MLRTLIAAMLLSSLPSAALADPCRLETREQAERALALVEAPVLLVSYCWWCDAPQPLPVRVKEVALERTEPRRVRATAWSGPQPVEEEFPLEALVRAERDGTGPLAAFLRLDVERSNSDTTGYLGPNDPYLVQQKRDQYAMRLRHVREDHDLRTWDELLLNGAPADPRRLYVPVGGDRFRSLGLQVGCMMDGAPRSLRFRPVRRDPARAAPPRPFVADVTGQCYDGACPRPVWRALRATPLFERPGPGATPAAELAPGEEVVPSKTESHVVGSRAVAARDHEQFFEGDVFYVLDSQAEGFVRVWLYGEVFVVDGTGIDLGGRWSDCRREPGGCWARAEGAPSEVWWARVRRRDGSEGWVRDPLQFLDGVLRSD